MAKAEHLGSLRLEQQFTVYERQTVMMALSVPSQTSYSFPSLIYDINCSNDIHFSSIERIPHPHIRHKSSRDVDHEQQGPLLARPGAAQKLMTADWRVLYCFAFEITGNQLVQ